MSAANQDTSTKDALQLNDDANKFRSSLPAAVLAASSDAISCETLDGTIRLWNQGAKALFGYDADEVIGKSISLLIPPELTFEEQHFRERLQAGETINNFETTRVRKDGGRVSVSLTIAPLRDEKGEVIAASTVAREIGDRQRADRAQAQLAAIVESSDDAIISKTLDGVIQSWNHGAEQIFGYTAKETIGQSITMLIPPELHEEELVILNQIRRGKRISHFETIRIAKDGRRIAVSLTVSPVRNAQGTVIGASKIARDVTERKRVEQMLRENQARLVKEANALARLNEWSARLWRCRSVQEGLDEILRSVMELFGASRGQVHLFDPADNILRHAASRGCPSTMIEALQSLSIDQDSPQSEALRLACRVHLDDLQRDDRFAAMHVLAADVGIRGMVCTPFILGNGARIGVVSTYFSGEHRPAAQELRQLDLYTRQACDFIQRSRMEERLRQSEETLLEADRRKDAFLALLAHELRNPLAPIRYALATTKKEGSTPEQRRRAEEVIERQVAYMSHLLDDLLDMSRITRGTLELRKTQTDLTTILSSAIEAARPIIDSKAHLFSLEMPEETIPMEADPVRLAQVFSNLLINAAKYTDHGGRIFIGAVKDNDQIVVTVRDNGIGITQEMMPKLFTMFTQSRESIGRSEGGLGVGLALVRGLVRLHGGSVSAHSAGWRQGSEFVVRIPIESPRTRESDPELDDDSDIAAPALKILVVDDNRDAAETCKTLLELCGHQVQIAHTGLQALELARKSMPQMVLLDIGLPDLSGYEVAKQVRTTVWGRDLVLVALTGMGQEEDRQRAFAAGFDHHLTKPIAPEVLESLVKSYAIEKSSQSLV